MRRLFGLLHRQPDTLVERLCRESGRWIVLTSELDWHEVRSVARPRIHNIKIRHGEGDASLIFQSYFPVRFSLENPPSGLFGRLLMRNFDLYYASWVATISGSCEAGLQVVARLPRVGIDATLLDRVCHELADESDSFDRELRDKFRYGGGGVISARVASGGGGGYGTLGQDDPGVRFLGAVAERSRPPLRGLPGS